MTSKNEVVANALNAVANADDSMKVKVVAYTETLFGKRRDEKVMTVEELRNAFAKIGHGRLFADVMRDFYAGKEANPSIPIPCEAWVIRA